jgi:hypothetical protein
MLRLSIWESANTQVWLAVDPLALEISQARDFAELAQRDDYGGVRSCLARFDVPPLLPDQSARLSDLIEGRLIRGIS